IARADVVVENFLKAPIDFGTNEHAVVCSIRGFDSDTPEGMTPGYDLLAQAGSGLMSITGDLQGEPSKVGVALADVLTAHHAFGAINAALVARECCAERAGHREGSAEVRQRASVDRPVSALSCEGPRVRDRRRNGQA